MHFEYKIGPVIHYVYSLECFKEVTSPSLPPSQHPAPHTPPPPPPPQLTTNLKFVESKWQAHGKINNYFLTIFSRFWWPA